MTRLVSIFVLLLSLTLVSCETDCIKNFGSVTVRNESDLELYVEVDVDGVVVERTNLFAGQYTEVAVGEGLVTVRAKETGFLFQPQYSRVSYSHSGCSFYEVTAHSQNSWPQTHYLSLNRDTF